MDGTLEDRLAALERAVTDGEHDCSALAEGAATADRVSDIEAELEELTDRVAELEAATQALRGYVGNVRSVNSDVEERADLALSKAEAARRAVDRSQTHGNEETSHTETERTEQRARQRNSSDCRAGREPTEGGERERERCRRCERPFGEEQSDGAGTDDSGVDVPGPDGNRSGLDALREPSDPRSDELRAIAGTETDGGRPEPTTDRPETSPEENGERRGSGVVSRVRSLL